MVAGDARRQSHQRKRNPVPLDRIRPCTGDRARGWHDLDRRPAFAWLGVASLDRSARRLMQDVLPFTWGAFVVAAITGSLMFVSDAVNYAHNFFFRGKLVLLVLAGVNMAVFHLIGVGNIARWGVTRQTPWPAKAAAAVSLLVWIAVVAFGRGIGFTMH